MEFMELIKTPKVDDVTLMRSFYHKKVSGTLCLTSHHLLFVDRSSDTPEDEVMILYTAIEHMEKKFSGIAGVLTIYLKDFTVLKFKIPQQEDALNVAASIESLSSIGSASSYYPYFLNVEILDDGWSLFRMEEEYNKIIGPSTDWRISAINKDYKVCRSYPSLVVVPSTVTDELIKSSAHFRQHGRFPVLSYLYQGKVPILRSSQPMTGANGRRCKEDEKFLALISAAHALKGTIIDTRSTSVINAQKNKKGGGIETDYYTQWKRTTQNIEKITHVSDTINRLYEACNDTKSNTWLLKLDNSGWLRYVESCMMAAVRIVTAVCRDASPVLIHGDTSTDITLLLTSLSQVLISSECRTIHGFEGLIMREWVWAGYPFTKRHLKIGISPNAKKENAAVFLLFLDCVHQVMHQYTTSFEFNDNFLVALFENSYYSNYGTFLFDCEFERDQSKLRQSTKSLWSYLNEESVLVKYRNPLYELNQGVLWPSVSPQSLRLWYGMFAKSTMSRGPDSKEELEKIVFETQKENDVLKEKARALKKRYEELLQTQTSN